MSSSTPSVRTNSVLPFACLNCRKLKVKCRGSGTSGCRRFLDTGVNCVMPTHDERKRWIPLFTAQCPFGIRQCWKEDRLQNTIFTNWESVFET
ncbi:hypothetical protein BDV12DRAFT_180353 [Aspergillus spectabilis]